jgi:hypothetical protein
MNNKKTKRITITVTEDTYNHWKEIAAADYRTLVAWITLCAMEKAPPPQQKSTALNVSDLFKIKT